MIFNSDQIAGCFCCRDDCIFINGFDGVHINNAHIISLLFQRSCSFYRSINTHTGGNNVQIFTFFDYISFTDFKVIVISLLINKGLLTSRNTNIHRTCIIQACTKYFLTLLCITRSNHGHIGKCIHNTKLDNCVMSRTIT